MALTKISGEVIQEALNVRVVTATQVNVGSAVTIHSAGFSVGGSDLHSTGITVKNVNSTGVITATSFSGNVTGNINGNVNSTGVSTFSTLRVGTAVTISGGIVTATSFSGNLANTLTLNTSGTGLSGSTTYNNSGASTFTVISNATNANTASAIVARDASGNFSAGTITATLSGNATSATTATNVTTNANLTGDVTSTGNATAIAAGVIVDADINASAGIVDTKLATISTAGKVSNSATTATNANTASAIVARDASGNFSAGTITASLTGTATSTTNIPNLTGAITSNNTTTSLGSFSSANLATALTDETGSGAAVFATSPTLVTPVLGAATATSIIVGSGVTINASGINASGIVTASQLSTGVSGTGINITTNTISGPATLTIDPAAVGDNTGAVRIKGDLYVDGSQFIVNSTTIELADFNVGIATTVGTNLLLDGAGIGIGSTGIRKTITWNNSASALTSSEDWNLVTGKQYEINGAQVLSSTTLGSGVVNSSLTSVGTLGQLNVSGVTTASRFVSNVATGTAPLTVSSTTLVTNLNADLLDGLNSATANTVSTIVARDASGNFSAGTITASLTGTASNVTTNANLTGDVTSTGNATSIAAGVIVNADINASAGIVDTKLATIATAGKVSNSATTATNANTVSTIVARDASGNFSAGTITAALTGTATSTTNIPNLTGDVTSTGNATAIAAGVIVNADINASAGIVDTKLATISTAGKVSNSATTAVDSATGNTIVLRSANGDDTRRYGFGSYFNSSDDVSSGTLTYLMGKFGDNYYRSATAAKVATFISGQTMNISGSSTSCSGNAATATTATNLSGGSVAATTGTFSNYLRTLEQVRATGWYGTPTGSSYTGLGVEIGMSAGQGYLICYNRNTSDYGILNISNGGATIQFPASGSTINVTGAISGNSTITGTQLISNIATGTAPLTVTSTTQVNNLNSNYLNGITATQFFNNMGNNHSTRTDFNASTNFGFNYIQGTTNGPGIPSAKQYYNLSIGLGNDYAYSQYAMEFAIPRTPSGGNPYPSIRFREGGAWGSWSKIYAGYADSAPFDGLTSKASGSGTYTTSGDFRAPIFYDSNNTGYYTDPASTSNLNALTVNSTFTVNNGWSYVANNYGYGIVGLYSASIFQLVFAMGDAYKTTAAGGINNLYGIAWSHPNAGGIAANLNDHGMIVAINGGYAAAISSSIRCAADMRTPIYYDSQNTAFYTDPASTSVLNNVQVTTFGVGTAASGTTGEIRATNNVTAYYSDERLKENITTISSALSKLLTLRGVTFNSNKIAEQYGYIDKKEQVGVIAQDVEKVLPQVVVPAPFDIAQGKDGNEYSKSGENYKTVHYDKLVPLLIEAIKELKGEIEELKSKIPV